MVNYYDILKVSPEASKAEIKSAYRRLAHKLHPDRNNGSEETALKFAAIAEAYEILGNSKERVKYDRKMSWMPNSGIMDTVILYLPHPTPTPDAGGKWSMKNGITTSSTD